MKTLLTATCIISIVCGYIIGKSRSTSPEESQNASSIQTRYDRPNSRDTRARSNGDNSLLDSILGSRSISQIPAAELAELIKNLSKEDPSMDALGRAKQSFQLHLLLAKCSSANLSEVATSMNSDPKAIKNGSLLYVISALAKKDSDRALNWISTQENQSKLYPIVISTIAKDDPAYASDLLNNAMLDGNIDANELFSVSFSVGKAMATLGADPFLAYIDSLPKRQQSTIAYNMASMLSTIPDGERIKILDQLYQRNQDGSLMKGINVDKLFSSALLEDPTSTKDWFSKLPDNEHKMTLRTSAAEFLYESGDKDTAAEWMKEALAKSPGKEKEIIHHAFENYNSPDRIAFFAQLLPEDQSFTAEDLETQAIHSFSSRADALNALVNCVRDPNEKAILVANTLKKSSVKLYREAFAFDANDLERLSRKVAAMGFTGENATLVNSALEVVKNPAP